MQFLVAVSVTHLAPTLRFTEPPISITFLNVQMPEISGKKKKKKKKNEKKNPPWGGGG